MLLVIGRNHFVTYNPYSYLSLRVLLVSLHVCIGHLRNLCRNLLRMRNNVFAVTSCKVGLKVGLNTPVFVVLQMNIKFIFKYVANLTGGNVMVAV